MSTTTCSIWEMGRTVLRWLSTDAGALSRALRRGGGKANDASTIPPIDAISWRRVTSIVKSVLLGWSGKQHLRGPTLRICSYERANSEERGRGFPPTEGNDVITEWTGQ